MAAHCTYCNSTDIEARVTPPPKSINYFHCNECNRNFIHPVVDPEAVVAAPEIDALASEAGGTTTEGETS